MFLSYGNIMNTVISPTAVYEILFKPPSYKQLQFKYYYDAAKILQCVY
jgi:hypothetical protein